MSSNLSGEPDQRIVWFIRRKAVDAYQVVSSRSELLWIISRRMNWNADHGSVVTLLLSLARIWRETSLPFIQPGKRPAKLEASTSNSFARQSVRLNGENALQRSLNC